jgi:hypothetical protein
MIVNVDNVERLLPDFFVVGAAKGATTSLHSYLGQHPGIFLPEMKELYSFAFNGQQPRFKMADGKPREKMGRSWDEYFEIYKNSPKDCLMGDTSSWYLYYPEKVIQNIKRLYGPSARNIKIIMVLRNPIERAWSHYCMHMGHGHVTIPFKETITGEFRDTVTNPDKGYFPGYDYIGFGMYAKQVKAYLEAFDHVNVFLYEEFSKDSAGVAEEIVKFLGLPSAGGFEKVKRLNVSGAPRSGPAALVGRLLFKPYLLKRMLRWVLPPTLRYKFKNTVGRFLFQKKELSVEDRAILVKVFEEDIRELQGILGRDLSRWLGKKG